jgi:segregation and condensation protein A
VPDLLVKLQIYEGPLDLLLHLVQKNEVDLNDVPVALITAQYLEYLDVMEAMNLEIAAEFLVMAATLTQIKSRLLLPREEGDGLDEETADQLKSAIIDPLLAHLEKQMNFKEAAHILGRRQFLNSDVFARGGPGLLEEDGALLASASLIETSLVDLTEAFRRLSKNNFDYPVLEFRADPKTIAQRIDEIKIFLSEKKRATFNEVSQRDQGPEETALSFLAVLELARLGVLRLYQDLAREGELLIFLALPERGPERLGVLRFIS